MNIFRSQAGSLPFVDRSLRGRPSWCLAKMSCTEEIRRNTTFRHLRPTKYNILMSWSYEIQRVDVLHVQSTTF